MSRAETKEHPILFSGPLVRKIMAGEPDLKAEEIERLTRERDALKLSVDELEGLLGAEQGLKIGAEKGWLQAVTERDQLKARAEQTETERDLMADDITRLDEHVRELAAERDQLRTEVDELKHAIANWKTEEERWNDEMAELRAEVNSHVCADDPLPTPGQPLDLVQRARALVGGHWVELTGDELGGQRIHHDGKGFRDQLAYVSPGTIAMLFDVANTVTLAEPEPEPEPARRKLSFGEALACHGTFEAERTWAGRSRRYAVRDWGDGDTYGRGVFRHAGPDRDEWDPVPIAPWMLAAEWEACS